MPDHDGAIGRDGKSRPTKTAGKGTEKPPGKFPGAAWRAASRGAVGRQLPQATHALAVRFMDRRRHRWWQIEYLALLMEHVQTQQHTLDQAANACHWHTYTRMRLPFVAALLSLPLVAFAGGEPSLAFPERKIEVPPLSLAEAGREQARQMLTDAPRGSAERKVAMVATQKKFVSRMPVVAPNAELDPKMIKAPDASVNHTIIVQTPNVELVK